MEAYTSMKLNVKGNTDMNEVADLFKNTLLSKANDDFSKKYAPVFCDDMQIKDNEIIVDDSCSLSSAEMEFFKDTLTTIAAQLECEFTFEAHNEYCSCGYEEFDEAIYKNGILTYKSIGGDCMFGTCGECGELEVSAFDYDPSKTYVCPECGRVVSEEELFPNGVPTWEVEEIRIK